jgi:hypothetical protein
MKALPYNWISSERCVFALDDKQFGIYIEYQELTLQDRDLEVANITFGLIKSYNFDHSSINTELTNFGKPRTILSTVAEACLANFDLMKCDVIALAAADQAKDQRIFVYSLAMAEIKQKKPEFRKKDIQVRTKNGSRLILMSKIEFTKVEQDYIIQQLDLEKL